MDGQAITWAAVAMIVSAAGGLIGIIVNMRGMRRNTRIDDTEQARLLQSIKQDTDYTKRSVEDIKVAQRVADAKLGEHDIALARNDESLKSLHKRVDRVEKIVEDGGMKGE